MQQQNDDLTQEHINHLEAMYDIRPTRIRMTTRPSYPPIVGTPGHISNAQAQVPIDFDNLRTQFSNTKRPSIVKVYQPSTNINYNEKQPSSGSTSQK